MKVANLLMMVVVAGLYGCSDKEKSGSDEAKTSLIEKSSHISTEMADKFKQSASETGEAVSASLEKAGDKVAEAVDSMVPDSESADEVQAAAKAQATDEAQAAAKAAGVAAMEVNASLDTDNLEAGKAVYAKSCMACHSAGVAGAPKISDAAAWEPRVAQGMDTLNEHAIKGFTGSSGVMPPKGGFAALSDDDVKAAVAYMVSSASK